MYVYLLTAYILRKTYILHLDNEQNGERNAQSTIQIQRRRKMKGDQFTE